MFTASELLVRLSKVAMVKCCLTFQSPNDDGLSAVINRLVLGAEKLKGRCQNVCDQNSAVNSKQVSCFYRSAQQDCDFGRVVGALGSEAGFAGSMLN